VRRKLLYDLYYLERRSMLLDLRIICCTVLYAFGLPFKLSRRLFRIPTRQAVEGTPPAGQPRSRKAA
jgi:hypothetical protein